MVGAAGLLGLLLCPSVAHQDRVGPQGDSSADVGDGRRGEDGRGYRAEDGQREGQSKG